MSWDVYVVVCFDNSFYCGITTDIERRIKQHNGELSGGAKYTRGRRPCRLVYKEKAENRSSASKKEYWFKKLSRREKEKYISYPSEPSEPWDSEAHSPSVNASCNAHSAAQELGYVTPSSPQTGA